MATGGVGGNGVRVAFSATSPVSWTAIGQIEETDIPALVRDALASSTHASRYKRKMPGMIEIPDINMTLLSDLNATTSAAHAALRTNLVSGTTLWFRFEVPEDRDAGSCIAFEVQAFVQKWQPKAPLEGKQETDVTLCPDGQSFTVYADGAFAIS